MDCYYTALYEVMSKDRNKQTFNTIIENEDINIKRIPDTNDETEIRCRNKKILSTIEYNNSIQIQAQPTTSSRGKVKKKTTIRRR